MLHTKDEIIKIIDLDEPDYSAISALLTTEDIPILISLSTDPNTAIATKAISCLGHIDSNDATVGIQAAASHANPIYRMAAAHALRNISKKPVAISIVNKLLDDQDVGVRKFALKTIEFSNISSLKEKVLLIHNKEQNETLKNLAKQIIEKLH